LDKITKFPELSLTALKLDWNEGVIPPPPSVRKALIDFVITSEGNNLKWYPHLSGGIELSNALTAYCNVIPENILITNGSDDALILLCYSLLGHGKTALVPSPTYEHFCVNAINTGASLIRLQPKEDPFTIQLDPLISSIETNHPNLVYIVSPNNPTGVQWLPSDIKGLASRYPNVHFIVDEAYYEFGIIDEATGKPLTCVPISVMYPNVIITRTFSKAFCLAAIRCGYIVAHPNTIENLRSYYNPKSVNELAQIAALNALKEYESYYLPYIKATNAARNQFIKILIENGIMVKSGGGGNFVCVKVQENQTQEICRKLEEKAIFVRDINSRFPGFIRISIGLDMSRVADAIITAIKEIEIK
jgi:histidinol-phosphate aminotransferase